MKGPSALPASGQLVSLNVQQVDEEVWRPRREHYLIQASIITCQFITTLDLTILSAALGSISSDLGGSTNAIFWAPASMLLANGVVQPFVGAMSDSLGRRPMLLANLAIFTLGTIICAVAQNIATLIAGRVIQGIGAGGVVVLSLIVMTDIYPRRQLSKFQSVNWLFLSIATAVGPILGGVFAQDVTWRWIFYFNFPFIAIALVGITFTIRLQTEHVSFREKLRRIDWPGGFLFIASISSFLIAIGWGGTEFSWHSASTLVPLILGICGMVASIFWEKYAAERCKYSPFLRLRLFDNLGAVATYASTTLFALLYLAIIFIIPLYLQSARGFSPLHSSIYLLSAILPQVPAVAIAGALMGKWGTYRWSVNVGLALATLGLGCMIHLSPSSHTVEWVLELMVFGASCGFGIVALNNAAQAAAVASSAARFTSSAGPHENREQDRAYATTTYSFVRAVGMTLGVAITSTMLQNFLHHHLLSKGRGVISAVEAASIAQYAAGFADSALKQMPPSEVKTIIIEAYAATFRNILEVLTGIAGLAFLISLAIKEHGMDGSRVGGDFSGHRLHLREEKKGSDDENALEGT